MTFQEQHIAIVEWMGWKWYRRPATGPWAKKPYRCLYNPNLVPEYTATLQIADMTERECNWAFIEREGLVPPLTLDWLHECEEKLTTLERTRYLGVLYCVVETDGGYIQEMRDDWKIHHATKEHRLESMCRTLFPERFTCHVNTCQP